jgi:acyl-CoA reductase-like NAD-dependent aldehyde dehydrogenase
MSTASQKSTTTIETHGLFIDGAEVPAAGGEQIDVTNPATGKLIARIAHANSADIDRAVKSARNAFESRQWGQMNIRSRSRLINRLADAFEENLDELYQLETMNNGRPVKETRAQLRRLPDFFRYNAGLALARRDHVIPVEGNYLNYTQRTPLAWLRIARRSITRL